MSSPRDYDVAIVGYGPVGALAAIALGQRGYRVGVFERRPEVYPLPRAVVFDDEIARIFQGLDLAAETQAIVDLVPDHYEWRNPAGEALLRIDWSTDGPSGWRTVNFFSQPELQRVLDERARSLASVEVHQGWEVGSVTDRGDHVAFEARGGAHGPDGRWGPSGEARSSSARFLIGADGANGRVRESIGTTVHDLGFRFDWLILDVIPHDAERRWSPMNLQVCDPRRPTTIVGGGPGRRRWEFMRLPGETIEELNTLENAWRLLESHGMTPENCTLERHVVYTFGAAWSDVWRRGRVMIAGDAAHLMPPFAGQGMCSGLRDVANLAWKLDLVLSGRAPEDVLDSYGPERTEHVRAWIDFSVALGQVICVPDLEEAAARDERMIAGDADPRRVLPAAPPSGLGLGGILSAATGAGELFIQARVEAGGRSGRFDDVVGGAGSHFVLLAQDHDPTSELDASQRDLLERIGTRVVVLGRDVHDSEGAYAEWFADHSCRAVLVRPDFYVFGAVESADALGPLIEELRTGLTTGRTKAAAAAAS